MPDLDRQRGEDLLERRCRPTPLHGNLEILSLAGTVAANGAHLHAALSRADGQVLVGHLGYGCVVRTTAEILLGLLPGWHFSRTHDAATGYAELAISPAATPRSASGAPTAP